MSFPVKLAIEEYEKLNISNRTFIAYIDALVIGFIEVDPGSGVATHIYVEEQWRRQGVARKLWETAAAVFPNLRQGSYRTELGAKWSLAVTPDDCIFQDYSSLQEDVFCKDYLETIRRQI